MIQNINTLLLMYITQLWVRPVPADTEQPTTLLLRRMEISNVARQRICFDSICTIVFERAYLKNCLFQQTNLNTQNLCT